MTCFFIFLSLEGKSDFVTNNCDAKPVQINNKSVEIIISKIIKIGLCLRIGKELMTEIPAGTNRNQYYWLMQFPQSQLDLISQCLYTMR